MFIFVVMMTKVQHACLCLVLSEGRTTNYMAVEVGGLVDDDGLCTYILSYVDIRLFIDSSEQKVYSGTDCAVCGAKEQQITKLEKRKRQEQLQL